MKVAYLSVPVAVTVLVLASCDAAHNVSNTTSARSSPTQAASSPSPAPSPLTTGQSAFVAALEKGDPGLTTINTPQAIAAIGQDICNALAGGGSQVDVANQLGGNVQAKLGVNPTQLVALAAQDICPPTTLLTLSGSGSENSQPFMVSSGPVTAAYTYDCSQFGPQGSNFIADMETVTSGLDYQSIANQIGEGGNQTTTLYPQDSGSQYYVAIIAGGCTWSLTITQQG